MSSLAITLSLSLNLVISLTSILLADYSNYGVKVLSQRLEA